MRCRGCQLDEWTLQCQYFLHDTLVVVVYVCAFVYMSE